MFGWIADHTTSRRSPLLFGLVLFAAATALLCVGTDLGLWIAGRLLQGISSAIVWTVGLALLVDTVSKYEIAAVLGVIGFALSFGTVFGPLIGGVVYQHGGYYAVFGLAFGFLGFDIFLRLVMVEKKIAKRWLPEEQEENNQEKEQGEQTTEDTEKQEEGHTLYHSMPPTEKKDERLPAKPTRLPSMLILVLQPRMLIALLGSLVVATLWMAFDSVLPIFVQDTFHWDKDGQGLIFLALSIPHLLDPISGKLVDRFPQVIRFYPAGFLLLSAPFYVLLRLIDHDSMGQKVLLCALLAIIGSTFAFMMPAIMAEFTYLIDAKAKKNPDIFGEKGAFAQGYGLFNVAWAAGGLVGPLWAGTVKKEYGWGTMGWSFGLLAGATSVFMLLFFGGWIGSGKKIRADEE